MEMHGERLLATAMIRQALGDAQSTHPVTRRQSRAWLVAPGSRADRELWLQLAKIDDSALRRRLGYVDEND